MSQIQRMVNKCDVCGHEWVPAKVAIPSHCTSSKCRSRKWNKGVSCPPLGEKRERGRRMREKVLGFPGNDELQRVNEGGK